MTEHSPYLRRRSEVRWHPWGKEAFEKATWEKLPIFLLIGSSASHWCRLMDEKSFQNTSVAELLNKCFVCIKVDHCERPDVAKAYLTYLTYLSHSLTDDLEAGTPLIFVLSHDPKKHYLKPLIYETVLLPSSFEFLRDVKEQWDDLIENGVLAFKICLKRLPKYGHPVTLSKSQKGLPEDVSFLCPYKKVVLKLDFPNDKAKHETLRTITHLSENVSGEENKFTLIGHFDLVDVVNKLRELCYTEVLTVGPAKEPKKEEKSEKAKRLYPCAKKLASTYNEAWGGLGSDSKFPRPVDIQLMLYHSKSLKEAGKQGEADEVLEMVCFTMCCMAKWGIHDHIGGGFHRVDIRFCSDTNDGLQQDNKIQCLPVPHFEKMLYDQGQLANVYLDAFSFTKDPLYSYVSRGILDFLRRDMQGQEGGFFSAVDGDSAESEGGVKKKGAFYQWTISEVDAILKENAEFFMQYYNFLEMTEPNDDDYDWGDDEFEERNVPTEKKYTPAIASSHKILFHPNLGKCREALFEARSHRPGPDLDKTVIVSWNGLVISSLARASRILKGELRGSLFNFPVSDCDPEEYMAAAEKAACFIKQQLYNKETRRLSHSFWEGPSKVPGFLDDYAFLISGLLDLYEFGGRTKWLKWAVKLQYSQDELFLDREGGGYYNTTDKDDSVILRVKEDCDGAEPSGNSVSAMNLVRLASMFYGDWSNHYKQNAEHLLEAFGTRLKDGPEKMPLMCCAAEMLSSFGLVKLVVLAASGSRGVVFEEMLTAAHSYYDPSTRVIHINLRDRKDTEFWLEKNIYVLRQVNAYDGGLVMDGRTHAHVFLNNMHDEYFFTDPHMLKADLCSVEKMEEEHLHVNWKPNMPPQPDEGSQLRCGPACLRVISLSKSACDDYRSVLENIREQTGANIDIVSEANIVITGEPIQIQRAGDKILKLVDNISPQYKFREPSPLESKHLFEEFKFSEEEEEEEEEWS